MGRVAQASLAAVGLLTPAPLSVSDSVGADCPSADATKRATTAHSAPPSFTIRGTSGRAEPSSTPHAGARPRMGGGLPAVPCHAVKPSAARKGSVGNFIEFRRSQSLRGRGRGARGCTSRCLRLVTHDRLSLEDLVLSAVDESHRVHVVAEHRKVTVLLHALVGRPACEHPETCFALPFRPHRLVGGPRLDPARGVVEQEGGVGVEVREVGAWRGCRRRPRPGSQRTAGGS